MLAFNDIILIVVKVVKKNKLFYTIFASILVILPTLVLASTEATEEIAMTPFCEEREVMIVFKIGGILIYSAKVLIPVIIIILASIDLFKAMIAGEEKEISLASKAILLRVILGIIIFFIPTVIDGVMTLVTDSMSKGFDPNSAINSNCYQCLLKPYTQCEIPEVS